MSDLIKFNTEDALKPEGIVPQDIPVFELVPEDHAILKEVMPTFDFDNVPVNPNEFASSLVETCKLHRGYGLSANQCGFRYRVFVMGAEDNYVAFFNPEIIKSEGECHMVEGCLSFPFLGLRITRPEIVQVKYQDYNGEVKSAKFNGISARCFQHELDHLNGIVYTSLAKPMALQSGIQKRNKLMRRLRLK
jgi:peptide deformylase